MKFSTCFTLAASLLVASASAFVVVPQSSSVSATRLAMAEVPLIPEPEGGDELSALSSMESTRVKCMGEAGMTSEEDSLPVYKFWMQSVAQGELIKEYKVTMLKEAKKNANFPGFRKGQIPPYAMPQMNSFSIQEALIKTIEQTVSAYGLKSLPGSDGEVEVLEKVEDMCKGYKDNTSLPFTATFNCVFDPEKGVSPPSDDDDVVDVEVVVEDAEDAAVEAVEEVVETVEEAADEAAEVVEEDGDDDE